MFGVPSRLNKFEGQGQM